jgi:ribosome maturation protein Sdo1
MMFGEYGKIIKKEHLQEGAQWIHTAGLKGGMNNEFYEMVLQKVG